MNVGIGQDEKSGIGGLERAQINKRGGHVHDDRLADQRLQVLLGWIHSQLSAGAAGASGILADCLILYAPIECKFLLCEFREIEATMSQISKEAIAGVWPAELGEAHITQTFPSISASALGRFLGSLYGLPHPIGFLIHIATLPVPIMLAVAMFFFSRFRRYQLSSTRVRIRRGVRAKEGGPQLALDELDDVRLVVRPGQAFYRAADLELMSRGQVALTLSGVPTAEAFRQNILEARHALVQVRECLRAQEAATAAS